jgi:hypothetical protein
VRLETLPKGPFYNGLRVAMSAAPSGIPVGFDYAIFSHQFFICLGISLESKHWSQEPVNKSLKNPYSSMQASAQKVWGTVQQSIQTLVSPELYKLWFSNIRPKGNDHDCLTLEVENDFCEVWLEKN